MYYNNYYRRCRKAVAFGFKNRTKIDKSLVITKKYRISAAIFPKSKFPIAKRKYHSKWSVGKKLGHNGNLPTKGGRL